MKDGLYKIGDIADIFSLSVQTLRFYEKTGLFVPAVIEESTGYRYYSWEQFERLRQILFLRDFGLSLKDIKHQLDTQHSSEYKTLLEKCSNSLDHRIQSDLKLKQYIDMKIESMKLASYLPQNKTLFLLFPDCKVLKHDCVKSNLSTLEKTELAIIELISKYQLKAGIDSVGQFFSPEQLTNNNGQLIPTSLFVTEEAFTDDTYSRAKDNIINIPKGVYGVMYYQRSTDQSLPYIHKLLDDIEQQSFMPCGDIIRTILFDIGRGNATRIFDIGRGKATKEGYLACIRVLVKEKASDL